MRWAIPVLLSGLVWPIGAAAHVVLTPSVVAPGAEYAGALRIGHGCSGSATVALSVEVPSQMKARAAPKAGWRIEVVEAAPTGPGKTIITWRGRLPADRPDSFPIALTAPTSEAPVYLASIQTCEVGEARWVEIPAVGQTRHDLKFPAPVLDVSSHPPPPPAVVSKDAPAKDTPPRGVKIVDGVLRTEKGLPLYTFNFDTMVGMSHCEGECSVKRPPLEADQDASDHGQWGVIGRADGSRQWTYRTRPLYTFTGDTPGGPPTGAGSDTNWRVATY
jgi:predicted lipoprotein with Yx(FWY)xxD motif/uncharacterized protein YcnI